ncbi:MAG TPA: endonuclease/exonuclease/phosphatase family protein [Ktedonobacteraceae bacterium]|nr:endonuclease/exonuclease/phosphatase family protein [Ktedonobacteraceae bacterium]
MTRILSYNILVGATRRVNQLEAMISAANPDVVGLVEATNPHVVEELARRLDMQHVMSAYPRHTQDWQVALLSRLPILETKTHFNPDVMTKPVLEVLVEEPDGKQLAIFVTHLSAAFSHGWAGDAIRRREVRELIRIMGERRGTQHLVMGDFNSLAPGDSFKASALLSYIVKLDKRYKQNPASTIGHPHLDFVVPKPLRIFNPLLRIIPRSKLLCRVFDSAASLYAPRGCISLLQNAGYVDCFRTLQPGAEGFSCPAAAPAGRIDYIFASPELAQNLTTCHIPTEGNGVSGELASDHLPVVADFGVPVAVPSLVHIPEYAQEVHA